MKKISGVQIFRIAVLTFFLVLVTVISYQHQKLGGGPTGAPSIHSICPFGALETVYKVIAGGEYLKRTNASNFILFGAIVVLTFLFGRYFCGFLCALGWMQELVGKLGKLIFKKRFTIPKIVDAPLRYLKYVALVVILIFTWKLGDLVVSPYDPFAAFAHFSAGFGELFGEFLIGSIIFILMLVLSLFYDRLFCKYLCPMGAFLAILNKISFFRIKRDKSTCINCALCSKICPVNIDVAKLDSVKSAECINCMECVTVCPTKKNTLKTTAFGFSLKPFVIAVAGVAIYFGTIGVTNALGIWKTLPSNLTEIVQKDGKLDAFSIRGFMNLEDVSKLFKIDIEVLYSELNLDKNNVPKTTKVKELGNFDKNITEESFRETVAKIIGQNINEIENKPDEADLSIVKGAMTVKDLLDMFNINKEDFYLKLGLNNSYPETSTLKEIRDIMIKKNPDFEMENIRDIVREAME